jgi:hypothetical protein
MVVGEPLGSEQRHDCSFLNIDKKSYRKYLQRFECGDYTELFARRINPTRKFDDEAVKNAVFGLLHEPYLISASIARLGSCWPTCLGYCGIRDDPLAPR